MALSKITNGGIGTVDDITFSNGSGIDFSASAGSGASSSILDDYEEGTWTPVISDATSGGNTASTSSSVGVYTKIGDIVHIQCEIDDINTSGMGTGNFYIQGLPFTSSGGADVVGAMGWNNITLAVDETDIAAQLINGSTHLRPVGNKNDGDSKSVLNSSQLTSGSADIDITMTYKTT